MALSDYVDTDLYNLLLTNGDILGQLRMLYALIPSDGTEHDQICRKLIHHTIELVEKNQPSYTDEHETNINAVLSSTGRDLCVDCAVIELFDWNVEKFEQVDNGKDTSFKDVHGDSFDLLHDDSIQFESFPSDWYREGLVCDRCQNTIIEPVEEDEDIEED